MSFMPDPLHPALVHFPIVLVLFGTLAAVVAMFWRQGFVPAMAAALLALAALGAWAAVATGESDGGLVENTSAGAAALLEAHENWAKRTLTAAAIAAVLAIGSVALFKFPVVARGVAVAAALAAGTASWTVYETGHRGGALVYQYGAGVNTLRAASAGESQNAVPAPKARKEADRD
jgi:uncharacterized membrane protein